MVEKAKATENDPVQLSVPLPPNSTIGILGGGQLGRMLAVAAAKLGFQTIILEPGENCPAAQVANAQITAAYDDEKALKELANSCDVVSYEFENVPLIAAAYLNDLVPLYPPAKALEVAQDRVTEKEFLKSCGIEVAPFCEVENLNDLREGIKLFGKGVLKTRRFGYDGKGQHVFKPFDTTDDERLELALQELGHGDNSSHGFVLEDLIDFESEFSMIGARAVNGDIQIYDPASNIHEKGILRRSLAPATFSAATTAAKARQQVKDILENLNYVGVIGVEFFQTKSGGENGILVNEIAPRVHNTGHWSVEACATDQFEQHIRAITGLPLGSPQMLVESCEMDNLLGQEADFIGEYLNDANAFVTLYGKAEAREGRKMGHVTRLASPRTKN